MSQNPYSNYGSPVQPSAGAYGGDFIDPAPSRTSYLAITALVISIMGCIACILPGPGAFAAILGGLAIFFIARSQGRLRGIGMAVTAVVLGLFQTVAIIALLVGANQAATQMGREFFVPMSQVMGSIEKGDMQGARAMFTAQANAAITDDMLRDFARNYQANVGSFQKMPESFLETCTMFFDVMHGSSARGGNQNFGRPGETAFPLPAKFSNGSGFVIITIDPTDNRGGRSNPQDKQKSILNLAVVTLDGKEVWLMDPGDAAKLVRTPGGLPPPPRGASGGAGTPGTPAAPPPTPTRPSGDRTPPATDAPTQTP